MKKLIAILGITLLMTSCVVTTTTQVRTFQRVTLGMSTAQVRNILGPPERLLAFNTTIHGVQEVLQYRTMYNEVYILEFWNNRLVAYDFVPPGFVHVPLLMPPPQPAWGRPIFPTYRPPANVRPSQPRPPVQQPPSRPPANRPENNQPSRPERPSNNQPSRPSEQTRPSDNTRPSNVRPEQPSRPTEVTRPSDNSNQDNNTRQNNNTRPSNTRQEQQSRPTEVTRPSDVSRPTETSRPSDNSNQNNNNSRPTRTR